MKKLGMVMAALVIFCTGFIAGGIHTRSSIALELGGLGSTVDSLKSLGKTIVEMQENVDRLQQNIEDAKRVRDDISRYQGVYERVTGTADPESKQGVGTDDVKRGLINILDKPEEQPAPK